MINIKKLFRNYITNGEFTFMEKILKKHLFFSKDLSYLFDGSHVYR